MIHSIAEFIVNTTANNPSLVPHGLGLFFIATLLNNGLKSAWKDEAMPRWAKFLLGFSMPLAGNFWNSARGENR
jgi:hypothetical protein